MKSPANQSYARLTPAQRIDVIYKATILNLNVAAIARETDIKYNTIRNILFTYYRTGRTNKLTYAKEKPWFKPEKKGAKKKLIGRDITSLSTIKAIRSKQPANEPSDATKLGASKCPGASDYASTAAGSADVFQRIQSIQSSACSGARCESSCPAPQQPKGTSGSRSQTIKFCNLSLQVGIQNGRSHDDTLKLGLNSSPEIGSELLGDPCGFQNTKERAWEIVPSDVTKYEKETEMQNCVFIGPLESINAYADKCVEGNRRTTSILPQPTKFVNIH